MNRRFLGIVLVVLALALAGAVGFVVYSSLNKSSQQVKVPTVQVVVMTQDVPERTAVQEGSLVLKSVAADLVPPGAANRLDQVAGRMTSVKLFAGEIVLLSKLADTKGQSGLAYTLQPGEVVISFPSSDIVGTGAIKQGDRVDLLITVRVPENKQSSSSGQGTSQTGGVTADTTQVSLQNLRVLAIGPIASSQQASQQKGSGAQDLVTFAVSHQNALVLKALKDSGDVDAEIVLRAAGDDAVVTTNPVTIDSIVEQFRMRK